MTLNLHLQIIYLLRNAEQGKGCNNGARDAEKDYVEGMFGQAVYGTLSAIGAGAAAQIAAAKEAARKEAERKALEESMAARKEEAERQTIEVVVVKRDSSAKDEKVEGPKTTVTVLTQKDLARLKTLEEADTAYHKYALELKRMDQDMVPMTKDEFMKQNYPSLYSQTHQPAQAPHPTQGATTNDKKDYRMDALKETAHLGDELGVGSSVAKGFSSVLSHIPTAAEILNGVGHIASHVSARLAPIGAMLDIANVVSPEGSTASRVNSGTNLVLTATAVVATGVAAVASIPVATTIATGATAVLIVKTFVDFLTNTVTKKESLIELIGD